MTNVRQACDQGAWERRGLHVNKYVMDGRTVKIKRLRLKSQENDMDNAR